jgi:hypothetical protein
MAVARVGRAAAWCFALSLGLILSLLALPLALPARTTECRAPRIISLVPAASALLVEMGLGRGVVGRTADDRTSGVRHADVVGSGLEAEIFPRSKPFPPPKPFLTGTTPVLRSTGTLR